MARKATRRRRRRTTTRRTTRRRSSSGGIFSGGRKGFVDTRLLMAGVAVAGGVILATTQLPKIVPADIQAKSQYVLPAAAILGGLALAFFAKGKPVAQAAATGMIAGGALPLLGGLVNKMGGAGTAGARVAGYIGEIVSSDEGLYTMPDGSTVSGYLTDQGEVVDSDTMSVAGYVDLAA